MLSYSLIAFHLASASRVALRASLPQVVLLFVAVGMQPSPGAFLGQLAEGLAAGEPGSAIPWLMALWGGVMARLTVRRLVPATRGWHRHLPLAPRQHRQAMLLACVVGQLPMAVFWTSLWLGARGHGMSVQGTSLVALVWILVANGSLVLPTRKIWTLPLALVAWAAAALGTVGSLAVGCLCLVLRETFELGWRERRHRETLHRALPRLSLVPLVTWRALGRKALSGLPIAALLLGCGWLFLRNNDVEGARAALAVRLCGGLGIASAVLHMADQLRLRRPPWAWIRSQPWSGRQRVMGDALVLTLPGLPVVLGAAWLHPTTAPALLAWVAYLALRASAALWKQPLGAIRLGAPLYAEAGFVVLWVAVSAWSSVLLILLLPFAWGWAERAEQRFKVSRFHEMHHHGEGEMPT